MSAIRDSIIRDFGLQKAFQRSAMREQSVIAVMEGRISVAGTHAIDWPETRLGIPRLRAAGPKKLRACSRSKSTHVFQQNVSPSMPSACGGASPDAIASVPLWLFDSMKKEL
jgi:hypothetical protein